MRALWGLYRGLVTNTADPEGLGRLRAQVPAVLGQLETEWAWPVTPNIRGIAPLGPGDPVWIAFEGGEVRRPVWLGTWERPEAALPWPEPEPPAPEDPKADEAYMWMIVSP